MLKREFGFRKIPHSIMLLISIFVLVGSIRSANGTVLKTYYPSNYNIFTGTYLSGSVPTSVQTVGADYFIVRSSGTATSTLTYNSTGYNLLGGTTLVSGSVSNLTSNDEVYMTFRSYTSGTTYTKNATYFTEPPIRFTNPTNAYASDDVYAQSPNPNFEIYYGGFGTESGNITSVVVKYELYTTSFSDDVWLLQHSIDGTTWIVDRPASSDNVAEQVFSYNITSERSWTWSDISNLRLDIKGAKTADPDGAYAYLDWFGVYVECGEVTYTKNATWFSEPPFVFTNPENAYAGDDVYALSSKPSFEIYYGGFGTETGTIKKVVIKYELYTTGFVDDSWKLQHSIDGAIWTVDRPNSSDNVPEQVFSYDITSERSWTWDDIANLRLDIQAVKTGGADAAYAYIDWFGVYVESSQYTSEVELTGSNNTYTWTQLNITVDLSWTVDSVNVSIQVYNSNAEQYPTAGEGYLAYTSGAANTDETKILTITTNPPHFRNATANWKIKVKGIKNTLTQFDFKADWIEYKPTHYSEYTVSTEFVFSAMTTNTPMQLNFTVVSEYDIASVSVTIQVWNYSASAYATSGEAYLKYTSSGTNETKLLNINTNPQFYTSNGNAKLKITGVLSTPNQFQQEINQVKLLYSYDIHDVAVISVTASATEVTSGQVVNFSVSVKNNGTAIETFNVTLFYNETIIERKTVTNLPPGDQTTLEFAWNTTGLKEASYAIRAEASGVPGETDINNNAYTGAIIKLNTQTSPQPFDWFTTLLYVLPLVFVLLFLLALKLKRKKTTVSPKPIQPPEGSLEEPKPKKPHIKKKTDAFSEQFGMTHQQMVGKKMLLEIDPTSDFHKALSSFVSEAKNSDELLFILTNKNTTLHSTFSGEANVKFLLLTSKTSSPQQINEKETLLPASDLSVLLDAFVRIQKVESKETINVLFDNLSDIILRCEFEKTYKFMGFLLEAISSPKTTALFVYNPTAHDQAISSSIRGLFQNQLAYVKSGPKVGTL